MINIDVKTKEDLIKKVKRKIERCSVKIENLNSKKDRLSVHGYWDLGYFEGRKALLEEILVELEK